MQSCFFCELQLITDLLLIYWSYTSWSKRFISLKLCVRFSIFDFPFSFLVKFIFCPTKSIDSMTLKRHNSLQNKNNEKVTLSFTPTPLILKLQQNVLKFNDICLSWSSPKLTWRQTFWTYKIEVLTTSLFLNSNF